MQNKLESISLKHCYVLIEPQPDSTSSFSSEHKKYDRKSIGTIIKANASDEFKVFYKPGTRVIFDDSNSISILVSGSCYEVVNESAILGIFEED